MSTTTVTGNLGADANLKFTPSGAAVLEMSIAETSRRKTDTGWEDSGPTIWFRASLWGPFAEAIANAGIAVKGARVEVSGVFTPRTYPKDGQERVSFDVKVSMIGFPETRGGGQRPAQQQQRGQQQDADPWASSASSAVRGGLRNDEPPF